MLATDKFGEHVQEGNFFYGIALVFLAAILEAFGA